MRKLKDHGVGIHNVNGSRTCEWPYSENRTMNCGTTLRLREEIGWCAIRKLNEAIDPFLGKEILDLERSIGFEKGKWQVMGAELQITLNCHVV